jgi:hypothetical protein
VRRDPRPRRAAAGARQQRLRLEHPRHLVRRRGGHRIAPRDSGLIAAGGGRVPLAMRRGEAEDTVGAAEGTGHRRRGQGTETCLNALVRVVAVVGKSVYNLVNSH